MKLPSAARAWAYAGVALGATVSVAANIAHSYIVPDGAPVGWQPERGQVFGAAFWPLALAVSSEVLARASWGPRARFVGGGGVAVVATVAAVVSYIHLHGLLTHWSEHPITTWIGPLAVDGLMVVSTAALLAEPAAAIQPAASASGAPSKNAVPVAPPSDRRKAEPPARPATASAKPPRQAARKAAAKPAAPSAAAGGGGPVADLWGGTPDEQVAALADELRRGARSVPEIRLLTGWSEGTARRRLAAAEQRLAGGGSSATASATELADESARAGEM